MILNTKYVEFIIELISPLLLIISAFPISSKTFGDNIINCINGNFKKSFRLKYLRFFSITTLGNLMLTWELYKFILNSSSILTICFIIELILSILSVYLYKRDVKLYPEMVLKINSSISLSNDEIDEIFNNN